MEIILTGILLAIGWYIAPFVVMIVVGIFASIGYFFSRLFKQ
jgi:hypothetical protein